jgi:PAS domain S-box-containing protein
VFFAWTADATADLSCDQIAIGFERLPRVRAPSYSCTARVPGVQAFVATPVRVKGALYGTLEFASFEPVAGLLSRHNRVLVALLAEWVAAELADQQARPELKRISRRDTLILAAAGEGIYCVDLHGAITFANAAAAAITGYDVAELVGRPKHTLLHRSHPDGTSFPVEECRSSNGCSDQLCADGCEALAKTVGLEVRSAAARMS